MNRLKPIALYLPQFHIIPENDQWWGKGFTEWTNVTRAKPRFEGHYQPHLPADLGFYDLRLEESRIAQENLAKEFGIYGFCYYHYWFNGKRMLYEPLERKLKNPRENFPFMMCWANENWTRNWDGQFKDVLLEQHYSFEDDINHIKFLFQYFKDERYIKVDGKPVFAVYRTNLFPDIKKTAEIWRTEAKKAGIDELYLIRVESIGRVQDPAEIGFDASFEFQPNFSLLHKLLKRNRYKTALNKLGFYKPFFRDNILDYEEYSKVAINQNPSTYKRYPCITPMWDNTARRSSDALIFNNSTPEKYGKWLQHVVRKFKPYSDEENFLFINAWNEWAEGNHLEPCQKWGLKYLEKTAEILKYR
jgi:lipopolysaccharide biosynthesis protein